MGARTDVRLERHVVIDYLCGVPLAVTSAATGLPNPTIYRILARNGVEVDRRPKRADRPAPAPRRRVMGSWTA